MVLNRVPSACRAHPVLNINGPYRGFRSAQKDEDYKRHYRTLGIQDGSGPIDVRQAFVGLVKQHHPDIDSPSACAEKFREIENAYRMLQNKFAKEKHSKSCGNACGLYYEEKKEGRNSEVKEFDIKHTAPQHRKYLSFDGNGVGTPFEREKQHQKIKAATAVENVYNYRIAKFQGMLNKEDSLVVEDTQKSRDIKTRYGMERLVEDLIQQSMERGEFNNLRGVGKPLKQRNEHSPHVDFVTKKLNQVMINNGFMPAWITLQKEIKEETDHIKSALANTRAEFGPFPLSEKDKNLWAASVSELKDDTTKLNKKIEQFNLVVPILEKQMLRFDLKKESEKVLVEGEAKESSSNDLNDEKLDPQTEETGKISSLLNNVLQKVYKQ